MVVDGGPTPQSSGTHLPENTSVIETKRGRRAKDYAQGVAIGGDAAVCQCWNVVEYQTRAAGGLVWLGGTCCFGITTQARGGPQFGSPPGPWTGRSVRTGADVLLLLLLHTTREHEHYHRRGSLPQLVVFASPPHDKCAAWIHPVLSAQSQWQHLERQRCSVVAPIAVSSGISAELAVAGAATKANAAKLSCGAPDAKAGGKGCNQNTQGEPQSSGVTPTFQKAASGAAGPV